MIYQSKGELMQLLKSEGIWTKKQFGQNFLISPKALGTIIKAAEIKATDSIIEVGPGVGVLTAELLKKAKHVRSIELDRSLIPYLEKTFGSNKKFELEQGNVLKAKLPSTPYKLVANIPYNISSPLLTHFLRPKPYEKRPTKIVVLIQKEVAEKICAKSGKQSVLSLQIQIFGQPKLVAKVPKTAFYPAPKVDSAILTIDPYKKPLITDTEKFFKLIGKAFSQKRKKLSGSLKGLIPEDHPLKDSRPESLSIEDWKKLMDLVR